MTHQSARGQLNEMQIDVPVQQRNLLKNFFTKMVPIVKNTAIGLGGAGGAYSLSTAFRTNSNNANNANQISSNERETVNKTHFENPIHERYQGNFTGESFFY